MNGESAQSSCSGLFAPLITTVSKPKRNPARATVIEKIKILLFMPDRIEF